MRKPLGELINEERRKMLLSAPSMEISFGISENTAISLNNFSNHVYTLEENNNLQRFTKVFEQTYTRFLDLQKAEAQAREAQIEAALERVRAASMAMHKSEDLRKVVQVVMNQLEQLEILVDGTAIHIFKAGTKDFGIWASTTENIYPVEIYIPYLKHIAMDRIHQSIAHKEKLLVLSLTKAQKDAIYRHMFERTKLGELISTERQKMVLNASSMEASYGISKNTVINLFNFRNYIYSLEENNILQRFTKVFEQSYTRFLDLQKAETQAREAQIEAALERVRAASMAMHKTSQLIEVTTTLFEELKVLELEVMVAWITLFHRETKSFKTWVTGFDKQIPEAVNFGGDYNAIPEFKEVINGWLRGEEFYEYNFVENQAVQSYVDDLIALTGTQHFNKFRSLDYVQNLGSYHKYGTLGMAITTAFTAYQKHVLKRFSIVFEQAYTRFLDIQKAEEQAREAQIEAALERVRAASMAMHKTNQLIEVTTTLFEELKVLDLEVIAAWITLIHRENKNFETWIIGFDEQQPEAFNFGGDYNAIPQFKDDIDKWLEGEEFIIHNLLGNQAVQFYLNDLMVLTDIHHFNKFRNHDYIQNLQSSNKCGTLGIATTTEFTAYQKHVLKRFSIVFEQAYTRFLDIQKAEEQTREAQIEAALERVRAASMAMHKTSQLTDVTTTLFEELKVLEVELITAWIALFHRESNKFETWVIGFDEQNPDAFKFGGDFNNLNPQLKEVFNRWLRGEEFSELNFVGNKVVQSHLDHLIALSGMTHFNKFRSLDYLQNVRCFHKYGLLGMGSPTAFTPHQKHVLKRFSIVFEQVYTRFLDIQKAEAQAREAQIEAALEKVRAKTASMYKSTELEAVVSLVFQQLRLLDFDSKQCIIGIIDKETLEIEIWQSVDAQSGLPNSYKIPKLDHPFIQEGYDAYLKGEQYHERELSGAAKKSYDKLIFEQTDLRNVPPEVKAAIIQNEKIVTGSAYMSHGVIQVIGAAALSAEKSHILQRFAAAIDLTYTRFLDIQKAEQQKIQLGKVFSENQRLLHSILPAPIAEQIRQGQQTVVKRFEQVSILFADIVGFTVLSDRISPQEVVDILNGLFSKFDDLTDKYGLEKIKTIGDAYMVAAGVPEEKDNHAQLMFAFAKDMLQTLQGYNKVIGTDLKIRIGISSGPVVAGVIGKKKFAYDLWGDTVNTAARMEAYGHADCIQVSPTTYRILKKEATFEKIPNVAIKGKGKMDVYLWTPFTG